MGKNYIMALDAGTTSNRCMLFNHDGEIVTMAQKEFTQYYPQPGWVEQDAAEIWESILFVARKAMSDIGVSAEEISAIGIANQRETTIIWDRRTGEPVYHAIVWQCRRTAEQVKELKDRGKTEEYKEKTGLVMDPYFSATKIQWILDHVSGAKERAKKGDLLFGTVESWLVWNLTGGKMHVTDYTNASRTMLFNIHTLKWDEDILNDLDIPSCMLPKVVDSSGWIGETKEELFGTPIPICGIGGDQQCALFGQGCFKPGEGKNTYGTGGFLLLNTGDQLVVSQNGLVSTIAWGMEGKVTYALEGSVFVAGAVVQWLRDEMHLISSAAESEEVASRVEDTNGCYVVPAFTGLGAPYWDSDARGTIVGITRGVNWNHIVRACLESIAYEVNDVLDVMKNDTDAALQELNVDGGASANNLLMQMQADISGISVVRPKCVETTAMGAAFFAGLSSGFWKSKEEIQEKLGRDKVFEPSISKEEREKKIRLWHHAVKYSLGYAEGI